MTLREQPPMSLWQVAGAVALLAIYSVVVVMASIAAAFVRR